ncbi:peptidase [Pseudoclavibacter sp. AY1F1]|uniref:cation:proton antiporter n=1 Tax=Pseudoclavibacter sp. AY1F1 TaxID=2080583 RepID=UPI000CE73C59|nr:cation:proton antiporter [Pseudoclavibacter sp. AY1F1]PPF43517.1 peptidase [Pseudoclavibacter sp. AY1F1]
MESIAPLLVVGVLLVVGGTWLATKIGVAAPILLVILGVVLSYVPGLPEIEIEPELILAVVLPPILYAAAVNVPVTDFRRNLRAITGLSVVLVVISAVLVGFLLTWLLPGLPLAAAIALGAVVSPPDAVAATSIGKRLGLPSKLVTVLEGEGLVNDATALVLLRSAVAAIAGSFSFVEIVGDFAFAVFAAIIIGVAVGLATVWARSRINQPTLTTAISFVVPFLAFLPAESIHASGVLAVVVAGLVTGYKSARHLSAQDRISERMNWRTIQLLLENGVFLVMGLQISGIIENVEKAGLDVWAGVGIGLLVVVALTVLRALFIVPLVISLRLEQRRAVGLLDKADDFLANIDSPEMVARASEKRRSGIQRRIENQRSDWETLAREGLGWRGGAVLAWSGMRGVVTLAAAQSLPLDVPFRAELILIAFTVAIVSLLGMGGTLPWVIRVLRVPGPDEVARLREVAAITDVIVSAGEDALRNPELVSADGEKFDPQFVDYTLARRRELANSFVGNLAAEPGSEFAQRSELYRLMLEAEQGAMLLARASGQYTSETLEYAQMVIDTDMARMAQQGRIA